jgi:hypothetical protein
MSVTSAYSENGIGTMTKELTPDGKTMYIICIWDTLVEEVMEEDREPKFN